jgi:hypothetical protein
MKGCVEIVMATGQSQLTLELITSTLSAYKDRQSLSSRGRDSEKMWERGENLGCTAPALVVGGTSTPPSELDSSSSSSRSCCGVQAITRGCTGPAWTTGFLHIGAGASEGSSWIPTGLASPEIPESPDLSWLLLGACCCRTLNVNKRKCISVSKHHNMKPTVATGEELMFSKFQF